MRAEQPLHPIMPTLPDDPTSPAEAHSGSMSPSLRVAESTRLGPAYEVKFLLAEERARELEDRCLRLLLPDPHSDPALGGMYSITSLACESPGFGVFFRDKAMRNRKYRVRRYGSGGDVYLERKRSRQAKVRKRRVVAPLADLASIAEGGGKDVSHAWFVRELKALDLSPVCVLRYFRRALFGACSEGPMRVTFDRNIRGALTQEWSLALAGDERAILTDTVVCEFKFHNAMPAPLKALAAEMRLEPTGVSKYRACVRAFASELGVDIPAVPTTGAGVDRA